MSAPAPDEVAAIVAAFAAMAAVAQPEAAPPASRWRRAARVYDDYADLRARRGNVESQ